MPGKASSFLFFFPLIYSLNKTNLALQKYMMFLIEMVLNS